jgi:hypothetical protein
VKNGLTMPFLALSLQDAKQGYYLLAHSHQSDSVQITHRHLIIPQFLPGCQQEKSDMGVDLTEL